MQTVFVCIFVGTGIFFTRKTHAVGGDCVCFFALSMFLSYTADYSLQRKRSTAIKTTFAVVVISLLIYWFGEYLFKVLGITIDAFRIGAGLVLMLTAIALVNGATGSSSGTKKVAEDVQDITVVPLAIPTIVGPGTIGTLLVMGAEGGAVVNRIAISLGIIVAIMLLGVVLMLAEQLERLLKAMHQTAPESKRVLELNPNHPVVEKMLALCEENDKSEQLAQYTEILYGEALLTEGSPLPDPLAFVKSVSALMK